LARIAVLLAVPMTLGLIVGIVYAAGHGAAAITPAAATASPTLTPSPTGSPAPAAPTTSPAPTATPTAPAAQNMTCQIIVPANPLSARGLATPYQLEGPPGMTSPQQSGCNMANAANLGAFVQATIIDPATGKLSTYEPLVITKGTQPAMRTVVPALPQGAVVTVDFGFNGNTLTQVGATQNTLAGAHSVNGLPGSPFGQVSFLNGTAFFRAARTAEQQGLLTVPATGTSAATGQACPTTRSFTMIDQDQSDNVTTQYLLNGNGQTAQSNAANAAALAGATVLSNGSDNALLDGFLDPTLGCKPFTAPDLSNGAQPGTSQALDELSAAANQKSPIAAVPVNDPMTLVGGAFSTQKTNLYRSNVGQPPLTMTANQDAATYCQEMVNIQTPFLAKNQATLQNGKTPVPAVGNNLLTFMANRLNMSFTNLNCQNFGLKNPVQVTLDGNGAAVAATFNTAQQTATTGAANNANPAPGTQPDNGQNPRQQGQLPSNQG
jgi:hypothetical protein